MLTSLARWMGGMVRFKQSVITEALFVAFRYRIVEQRVPRHPVIAYCRGHLTVAFAVKALKGASKQDKLRRRT